ncbi:hypothetical protein D0D73_01280 [Vibrio parahaemolyticus]|nr:hypothetical protein [Vibrio parahaemolyticus]EGR1597554.1 hypothetical protein [Vibrio parahaemolyticus]EGR1758412.1 hypothetical protein [Vibrio parahaemolyticus]
MSIELSIEVDFVVTDDLVHFPFECRCDDY